MIIGNEFAERSRRLSVKVGSLDLVALTSLGTLMLVALVA
jgi:hypothetical protein